jgi:NAD(P)-dependent dehydrogenase (short-subunit alcohol dehydrogenase family)
MNGKGWAVVLGCSSGVGRAISHDAAGTLGLDVFGAHRNNWPQQAEQLRAQIFGRGCRAELVILDAGTPEGVEQGADALAKVAPPHSVKLFVHSLASASLGRFMPGGTGVHRQLIPKNFHKTLDTMANSFPWWAQALVARDLLAPGARLFGLTNPSRQSSLVNFGLMSAAKAALETYIHYLALEMGPLGYRVNLINFGTVETHAAALGFGPRWERFKKLCTTSTSAGRILTAEEVSRLVTLLCDERAEWFNGACIDFTGGQAQNYLDAHLRLGDAP